MAGDQWLGAELAGYRIDALVGRGGAGVVYRATHLPLQRPAAVKLLAPGLAADAEYRRRFEREARLAAGLHHPHIVPIYDAGYADGVLYLAMRYIDGPDLARAVEDDGAMNLRLVCDLLAGIAEGLDVAHDAGLVHRDVKPANVLLAAPRRPTGRRHAYLCDFGIAHATTSSTLTSNGQFLGTLQYCAPEQIQGRSLDGRADQYALACVVHHCLTGRVPYPADEPSAVMFAHISADPPRASELVPGLPEAVDDVIARGLAKQPDDRFPDCASFLHALAAAGDTADNTADNGAGPAVPPRTVIWSQGPQRPEPGSATSGPPADQQRDRGTAARLRDRLGSAFVPAVALAAAAVLAVVVVVGVAVARSTTGTTAPAIPVTAVDVPLSGWPSGVVIAPDGRRAYVSQGAYVSVVDTASNAVVALDPVDPVTFAGADLAITPDGRHVYLIRSRGVTVFDTTTNTDLGTIPIPTGSADELLMSPDGSRVFVVTSSVEDGRWDNNLVVIDTATYEVVATIPIPGSGSNFTVLLTPDGRAVYVAREAEIAVIDTATSTVTAAIPLPATTQHMVATPDSRHVYVGTMNQMLIIDTASRAVTGAVPALGSPDGMVIAPDGHHIHAIQAESGIVMQSIDTTSNAVDTSAPFIEDSYGIPEVQVSQDGRHVYVGVAVGSDPDSRTYDLLVIDSMSRDLAASIPLASRPFQVVPVARGAYVVHENGLTFIEVGA